MAATDDDLLNAPSTSATANKTQHRVNHTTNTRYRLSSGRDEMQASTSRDQENIALSNTSGPSGVNNKCKFGPICDDTNVDGTSEHSAKKDSLAR